MTRRIVLAVVLLGEAVAAFALAVMVYAWVRARRAY